MDSFYARVPGPPQAPILDPADVDTLDVTGRNRPLKPFCIVPGTESNPGLFHYGDEKTGYFSDGEGRLGIAVYGQKTFVVTQNGIEFTRKSEVLKVGPVIDSYELADAEEVLLMSDTVKGLLHVFASDSTYGVFHLPLESTTVDVVTAPGTSWTIDNDSDQWRLTNSSGGVLRYRCMLLGG